MDQAIIDAIADDIARLTTALRDKVSGRAGEVGLIVAAAAPAIVTYETGMTRYRAEKI